MKRYLAVVLGSLLLAGVAWVQVAPSRQRPLAELMPAGPLLYLEAKDFNGLLREWRQSPTKAKWLASGNYSTFAQSNLFQKLAGVYDEYARGASFAPGMQEVVQIAGTESALALYDVHDMQFVYATKLAGSAMTRNALWSARAKFEAREASGKAFYLRRDSESGKIVAFSLVDNLLIVATREDLMAEALALQVGQSDPKLADERWYADAVGASSGMGDLRMVLNLNELVRDTYFRSYWVQRNVSELKPFRAEIADLDRAAGQWTERRVLLRAPDAAAVQGSVAGRAALSRLASFVPANAGVYRGWADLDGAQLTELIREKFLYLEANGNDERRYAPAAPDESAAGAESDLETRIDAPPLPVDSSASTALEPLRKMLASMAVEAAMEVQSSDLPAGSDFIATPCALVIASPADWNAEAVKSAFSAALSDRVSTGGLGVQWTAGDIAELKGLARLHIAVSGKLLFIGNNDSMTKVMAAREQGSETASDITYSAGFRHTRERANYQRIMTALWHGDSGRAPAFFHSNLGSLSDVFGFVTSVEVQRAAKGDRVEEKVIYRF